MKTKLMVLLLVVAILSLYSFAANGQTVDVTISNTSAAAGGTVSVPIAMGDVTGLDVFSYNLTLTFDQTVLDAKGVTITGTLSEAWGNPTVSDNDGQIIVAGAGTAAMTGSGNLLYINFDVLGPVGSTSELTLTEMTFNEGTPAANITNGTFSVAELQEDWWEAFTGAHRGTGVCPLTGRVYVSNTSNYRINYFNAGNTTGTPDGYFEDAGLTGWLGPYGVDVADDGMVYVTTYGASKSVFQISYDGKVTNIKNVGENMRALAAYGAGANTVVYTLENTGKVFKLTTDGSSWTLTNLFNSGHNASVAATSDGNTIYTAGYNTPAKKWNAAGTEDTNFNMGIAAEGASVIAVRLSKDASKLFAMYNAVIDSETVALIGKVDPATGEILSSVKVGPVGAASMVNTFDVLSDKDFFWASSAGFRGKASDASVTVDNRPPFAWAGADQVVEISSEVTLDGSMSVDIDMDAVTYAWSVVSSPETVTLSDETAAMPTFTPNTVGDYVFQLVVNDGVLDSPADQVTITVFEKDFTYNYNVDADRNRDVANWGMYSIPTKFSTPEWDSTGGVAGTGALRVRDGGWGFAIERPLNATPGTNFKLTADVLVHGVSNPLFIKVTGLSVEPVMVQIDAYSTEFTSVELTGITVNSTGYIQIVGDTGGGADSVWVDNLVFDDDATLDTYTLSGKVTLSDMPTDMSGTLVNVVQAGMTDTTDENGDYAISGLINGMYTVKFTNFGYKDLTEDSVVVDADKTLDVTIQKNQAPIADAGDDILSSQAGSFVTFDGSGSLDPDGDEITYHWTAADPSIILSTATDNPVAGFRPTEIDDYKFYLVVNDGTEDSAMDSVLVSVTMPAPDPLGYEFVDAFTYLHAALGVVVDAEGKIWAGCYGYGSEKNLAVWNSDGTRPDWQPIMSGLVGTDTVTTTGNCYGMAVDKDGNVYFSNASEHVVMKFDYRDGSPLGGIRLAAGSPIMSVDENGNIFVGTVVGDTVWVFDKDFNKINTVYVEYIGRDLEVSQDGTVIYTGQFSGSVRRFEGTPTGEYVEIDNLPGPFRSPDGAGATTDIGVDMHGRLWVTEEHTTWPQADYMHIYSSDLALRETFGANPDHPWDNPRGTAFDHTLGDSLIYVVDFGSNNPWIQRWAIPGTAIPPTYYAMADVAAVDSVGMPVLRDKKVRIKGIITVANQFGTTGPAYIQSLDDSSAVAIYDGGKILVDSVKIGDEIVVSGKVGFYNGLTEIDPPDQFTILSSGNVVEPFLVTCADLADSLGEMYQSELVKIDKVHTDDTVFPSNGNMNISDKTGTMVMRIDKDTDIPGIDVMADSFSVVGVVSQYDSQNPYWGGYQLMPRGKFDIPQATGVEEESDGLPKSFALHQNYPNPFNPVTTIKYDLPKNCYVEIHIFNVLGQKVRTLVKGPQEAGAKVMMWNGLNDAGNFVASGTYLYMIKAADFTQTKRMTLLK